MTCQQKPEKQKITFEPDITHPQKTKHFKGLIKKKVKNKKRTEIFTENSAQMHSSFAFKTVEMRWRLTAVEGHCDKSYVSKLLLFYISQALI